MQRKVILDVVPRNKPEVPKRTSGAKPRLEAAPVRIRNERKEPEPVVRTERRMPKRGSAETGKWLKIFCGIAALFTVAFCAITYFATAEITVTRKTETVPLEAALTAAAGTEGDISYKVMTLERSATTTVPAATEQEVESKASGTVVIYNNYSDKPYRLIKNTRLESSSGLIFKLADTAIIPGKKSLGGKPVPGSVSAAVFADSNGPEYNVGFSDFTIPGLKGSPQYAGFYARSKAAIAGGWSGKKNIASDADISQAVDSLEKNLRADLEREARGEIPDSYIMPSGTSATAFGAPDMSNSGKDVTVAIHATFRAALFSRADISKISKAKSSHKVPEPSEVGGIDSFEAVANSDLSPQLASASPFAFVLKGAAVIRSVIDPLTLENSLAGKARSSLGSILADYPGISNADVKILPFWKQKFPNSPQKIKVIVQ